MYNNYESNENQYDSNLEVKNSKKNSRGIKKFMLLIGSALLFGVVAGTVFQGVNYISSLRVSHNIIGETVSELDNIDDNKLGVDGNNQTMSLTKVENGVSNIVENAMPSIVAIHSTVSQSSMDFFGRSYTQEIPGSGSGIIIGQNESEILIATNNHVISDTTSVEVVFVDDSKAKATIKGTAPYTDLAVISVNVDELSQETIQAIKIATLGDSDSTKLGEMSIAIGNALGYGQSITVGYISALDREITVDNVTLNVLQTDAAINPGNSGGALINTKGEVIGINSVKYVDTTVESIGYAIPISQAIPVINTLMNRETLKDSDKAYLGVGGRDVSESDGARFNMPVGFYIGEVSEGTAASKAGMIIGDILIGINDTEVTSIAELQDVLAYTKAGSKGSITVMRFNNGKYEELVLDIVFDARPESN